MGEIIQTRTRKFSVILVDLILIFIAYVIAFNLRFSIIEESNWNAFMTLVPWILLISLFFLLMYEMYLFDRKSKLDLVRNTLVVTTIIMIVTMAASFLLREFALPRTVIILAYFLMNIVLIIWKISLQSIFSNRVEEILFVGSEDEREKIAYQVDFQFGKRTKIRYANIDSKIDNILKETSQASYIVIGSKIHSELKSKVIYEAVKNGKIVYVIPDFYDLLLSQSVITTIDDSMVMGVKPFGLTVSQKIVKRTFDFVVSLIALIVLSPIFLLIVAIMKFKEPKGSIFYKQARLGVNNKEFTIYKFRSMIEGAENLTGPVLAGQNDPRITKFGQFIRSTRIDELPQFLNVLIGDMSIVGPRPEREFFIKQFEKDYQSYSYRSTVKPGITGYAQIMGKYTTSVEDKLRFDLFYIRNYSFILDLIIQFRTIIVLLDKTKSDGKAIKENVGQVNDSPQS